ncbi:hypothetical protein RND81_04G025900 [Saponaria officinalis]|uniref:Reverse transcriptase zinc-binding domain-containing protein n=1 Tax=Saponaria officinalis TaxID=3572 RepID=A0AAW1LG77_SAPOF
MAPTKAEKKPAEKAAATEKAPAEKKPKAGKNLPKEAGAAAGDNWDSICVPKEEGGFGIKEVLAWNKSLLARWIWRLIMLKGDLWSSWLRSYVLKNQSIWTVVAGSNVAESWRSMLKVRDCFLERVGDAGAAGLVVRSWIKNGSFDTSVAYQFFRSIRPRFFDAKVFWAGVISPKLCVTTVLALQNKLSTIDNICARGIVMVNRCVLCKSALESVGHLFFGCDYSSYVWHHLLVWLAFNRRAWALSRELEWVLKKVRRRHWRSQWLQVAFASAIHYIWLERNHRIFLDHEMEGASLISRLKFHISVRVLYRAKGVEDEILDALNGF